MRTRWWFLVLVTALGACDLQQYQPLNIAVYPSVRRCMLNDTLLECERLPAYLRDTLKTDAKHEITVSYAGSETVAKGDTSIEQIAALLKSNGYVNVRAVRFEMQ